MSTTSGAQPPAPEPEASAIKSTRAATKEAGKDDFTMACLSLLASREKRLESGQSFFGAHAFPEQMALLIDPAGKVLRGQSQKLSGDRNRFRRQRANLARH